MSNVGKYIGPGMTVGWHSFTPNERPRPPALGDKPIIVNLRDRKRKRR